MNQRLDSALLWSPRVLGIFFCLFLCLFALDAFGEGMTWWQGLGGFLIHISPMLVLLGVVALSWRWEWLGGVVFTGIALAYAYFAILVRHHPEWVPPIAGPLLLVGLLFLWNWRRHRRARLAA